jgi:hypothetical protein
LNTQRLAFVWRRLILLEEDTEEGSDWDEDDSDEEDSDEEGW